MARGQHHLRLAWVTGAALVIAAIVMIANVVMPRDESLWHFVAAPAEDGLWQFQTIDGTDVSHVGYSVKVHWGEMYPWYNGCNSCGMADDGARVCTLQACAEKPFDRRYQLITRGRPTISVDGDRMVMTVPGHRAVLFRYTERVI